MVANGALSYVSLSPPYAVSHVYVLPKNHAWGLKPTSIRASMSAIFGFTFCSVGDPGQWADWVEHASQPVLLSSKTTNIVNEISATTRRNLFLKVVNSFFLANFIVLANSSEFTEVNYENDIFQGTNSFKTYFKAQTLSRHISRHKLLFYVLKQKCWLWINCWGFTWLE